MLTLEIGFSDSRGRSISARAIFQGHLCGPSAPIRARKGSGFVEISANHGVAPAELSRKLTLEIGFSDSRSAAISAMAVSQGHLGGPNAPIRARKGRGFVEISANRELSRMLTLEIGFSDSRGGAISARAIFQGHLRGQD